MTPNGVPKKGWAVNVYVNRATGIVEAINELPPGGTTETVQIDLMAVKGKYKPVVGRPLAQSKILHVFDVKTSARIRRTPDFVQLVEAISDVTGKSQVHLPQVRERWSFATNSWQQNKRVLRVAKLARFVAGLAVVTSIAEAQGADARVDICVQKAIQYRQAVLQGGDMASVDSAKLSLYFELRQLMSSFAVSPIDDGLYSLGLTKWLLSDDAAIFDYDPEYDAP